jgi:hypothetical protein
VENIANITGMIGSILFLTAYFLLQKGKILHTGLCYLGMNLAGAVLLLISLSIDWNLPAFLLEAAWALISMVGIYQYYVHKNHDNRSQ